mmetsp:Transcript_2621/g.5490  ORF Transcript_2621/g.5490 Transcript_2621/m.5490 type:complete len:210 (-) Transcript_2621:112-741(-)
MVHEHNLRGVDFRGGDFLCIIVVRRIGVLAVVLLWWFCLLFFFIIIERSVAGKELTALSGNHSTILKVGSILWVHHSLVNQRIPAGLHQQFRWNIIRRHHKGGVFVFQHLAAIRVTEFWFGIPQDGHVVCFVGRNNLGGRQICGESFHIFDRLDFDGPAVGHGFFQPLDGSILHGKGCGNGFCVLIILDGNGFGWGREFDVVTFSFDRF